MKKVFLFCLILAPDLLNAQWIERDSLLTARQEAPCVVLDGKIYIVGGISALVTALSSVEIYDPSADSWTAGVDMPVPRHHHAMAVVDGKIYVMGGYANLSFTATDNVYMYDPDCLKWFVRAPLPFPSGAGDAVTYNGKIYFIGGVNGGSVLNVCFEYDLVTDAWTQKNNMPTTRTFMRCIVGYVNICNCRKRKCRSGYLC